MFYTKIPPYIKKEDTLSQIFQGPKVQVYQKKTVNTNK